MAFAASSALARRSAHVSPKSTNVFLSASALRASFASKCTGYQKLRMAASSPGVVRLSSSAKRRPMPPRRGCAVSAVATSGAITARVGSEDARERAPSPSRAAYRVASIERDNREGQRRRSRTKISRAVYEQLARRERAPRVASVRGGAVRRARVSSARDAPWLPIRVARGSRARARASHGLRRARASRTASPTRFGWWFPACGRAPAAPATPLRPLSRVRVRGASSSGRSRARPARRHGRACGLPDAHRNCRRFRPRGALSGSALALRGGQKRERSQHT